MATAGGPVLPNLTNLRVLVVDDDDLVGSFAKNALEAAGCRVHYVRDGKAGVGALMQGTFDLVLTDWQMPGMSGENLAQWVKAGWPALPVLLMTGWGEMMEAAGVKLCGPDLQLAKPFTVEQLLSKVAQVLNR